MTDAQVQMVLEPQDEYPHEPDAASNYNESMYLNAFDLEREVGAWFRIGNRVNEGYAEVTVCVYLPGGRVGFAYARPEITSNDEMRAGGLHIEVVTPFEQLRVTYEGKVCLLDDPLQMADPRQAFRDNPMVPCTVALDVRGVSPMYGGRPVRADGTDVVAADDERSFAKAHYEQHIAVTGTITVGDEELTLDGLGLRDKSWGPRYWQALRWYRWLPMVFGPDFAMMISLIGGDDPDRPPRQSGVVLADGAYVPIRECRLESDWDEAQHQTAMRAWVRTDDREYEVTGEVLSLIPLRNRRATPDGATLVTRITEAMTRFTCDGRTGMGMSEYLDQVVDGRAVGPDIT
ncbi:hypothetical protein HC251_00950 [Iamia sp. SCSIO 61187]|uniref:DUF7064 domain-containing protein n=1 Tax=Iamia sp. SCSIO 61187 TaxID=2722752 RepID=UPI001C638E6B|nr:hypothetical protein [Iamia sp. SCSIO 61187]QYG91141.1 hypothetical protein HC251_00950 [Iamia sp. SCSIO 61187]